MNIEDIKFKAKSTLDGAWVQGDLIHKEDGKIAILRNGFNISEVDSSTVCQYTGLKDFEGKELFEHDIIHLLGFNHTAKVIWSESNYAFMVVDEDNYWLLPDIIKDCEIDKIGNEFDK